VVELLETPEQAAQSAKKPQPTPPRELETYDLAVDEADPEAIGSRGARGSASRCPNCNAAVRVGAAVCINCGFNQRSGEAVKMQVVPEPATEPLAAGLNLDDTTGYLSSTYGTSAVARALQARQDEMRPSILRERILPIALLLLGLVWQGGLSLYGTADWREVLLHLGGNTLIVAVGTCLLVVAMFATAAMFGLYYGPIGSALLKAVALGVSTSFLADFLVMFAAPLVLMLGIYGIIGLVALTIALNAVIVAGPAWFLYELDLQEAGIYLLHIAGFKLLIGLLILVIAMTL
jgi:hypothetical protein